MNIQVVGAGFSGAVLARQLAEGAGARIHVIDERTHIGGNCHTEREVSTGVMVHRYGPHIFNTDNETVWSYIRRFGEFAPFTNRVKASIPQGIFSLPINLHSINQFFGQHLNPDEARKFIAARGDNAIAEPKTFEEQALKFIGRDLYEAFFRGYTQKQWGCDPSELPASLLKRLPVRFNYDDNYYNSRFQGIPMQGYTDIIRRVLDHPLISVELGVSFDRATIPHYTHTFFTGPIDAFFGFSEGRLGYRTVYWNEKIAQGDFQGTAVMNYPDVAVPYTRIIEHKHFAPWERHEQSVVSTEFSKETGPLDIPYYPKRLASDKALLSRYRAMAEATSGISFLGRLATYRYMDMHHVIGEALDFAGTWLSARTQNLKSPVFPNRETES